MRRKGVGDERRPSARHRGRPPGAGDSRMGYRNAGEVIRFALDQYNGRPTINVRVWYRDDSGGTLKPGRSGITLAVEHLPQLSDAMAKALAQARRLGLRRGRAMSAPYQARSVGLLASIRTDAGGDIARRDRCRI